VEGREWQVEKKLCSNGEKGMADDGFKKCLDFHGHICPGIAIGYRAAQVLMDRLGVRKAPDEERVAVVETDACRRARSGVNKR
jgi:formylmethanofuran dehydrogenase subunit E